MKIVHINCVYPHGSTGSIVRILHEALLDEGISSVVYYGRGPVANGFAAKKTCPEFYAKLNNLWSRFTGIAYGGCFVSTMKLLRAIEDEKPDIVHLHCLNGHFVNIYKLISWLNVNRVKTVMTLHAEFMHTANCSHANDCDRWKIGCGSCPRLRRATKSVLFDRTAESWQKMRDAFLGFDENCISVSVSPWLLNRAKDSPILSRLRHRVVMNGVDSSVFNRRALHGISDSSQRLKTVLHVTSSFSHDSRHEKGGWYVLELAKIFPDVQFIIVGARVSRGDYPSNVKNLGRIQSQAELAGLYGAADLTLIASRRETFSMVVAESLCCGTPVVGFKAGAPEQIALSDASRFVDYGDVVLLADALRAMLDLKVDRDDLSRRAIKKYAKEEMVKGYLEIYNLFITERN